MPAFGDLSEFLDPTLRLPIDGKEYVVPPADAATGLYCQKFLGAIKSLAKAITGQDVDEDQDEDEDAPAPNVDADAVEVLDDHQEVELYQRCLGPVYQELLDDGVDWPRIRHAGMTAFWYVAAGEQRAEQFWRGEVGKAGNRAERRRKTSSSTAAASTTRKRASTSGTSSRRTSSSKPRAKASRG